MSNDLEAAAELLMKALMLRAQYMVWSLQKFPRVAARCLRMLIDEEFVPALIDDEVLNEILSGPATSPSRGQHTATVIPSVLMARGVYPPNNHGAIPTIYTSSHLFATSPPHPQTTFGHCVHNFV